MAQAILIDPSDQSITSVDVTNLDDIKSLIGTNVVALENYLLPNGDRVFFDMANIVAVPQPPSFLLANLNIILSGNAVISNYDRTTQSVIACTSTTQDIMQENSWQ